MGRLDGKVAAVTGGASGIGEATVRRFVAEGAQVAFCDRDGERGQRVAAELAAAGAKVAFTQADVGTEAACLAFVNGAAEKFGRLDILVNNAGIRKYERIDEASAASWNEILNINLGAGADNFTILSTGTGTTTVNANGEADRIAIRAFSGPLTVRGGDGSDTFNIGSNANPLTNNGGNVNSMTGGLTLSGDGNTTGPGDAVVIDDTADTRAGVGEGVDRARGRCGHR